jgi:hypothetical protein
MIKIIIIAAVILIAIFLFGWWFDKYIKSLPFEHEEDNEPLL